MRIGPSLHYAYDMHRLHQQMQHNPLYCSGKEIVHEKAQMLFMSL